MSLWKKVLVIIITINGSALSQVHISGSIIDKGSHEKLIGANLIMLHDQTGITTDDNGYFIFKVPNRDTIKLLASHLGYSPQYITVTGDRDHILSIQLVKSSVTFSEIVVRGNQVSNENVQDLKTGVINLPIEFVHQLPSLLGETDALKILQLLPGVSAGSEGSNHIYVRGGNADQNLYLIDDVPIYQPGHLLGITSTFNPHVIQNFSLTKSGFPAEHGGRLSSIVNLRLKEGNKTKFEGVGQIGLLNSSATVEGPIVKEKSSYLISARRTYLDWIVKPFAPKNQPKGDLYFYDILASINSKAGLKDNFSFQFFQGRDVGGLHNSNGNQYDLRFGNRTINGHWKRMWNKKISSHTLAYQTQYFHNFDAQLGKTFSHYYSNISDLGVKSTFKAYINNKTALIWGGEFINHTFGNRGQVTPVSADITIKNVNQIPLITNNEASAFIQTDIQFSPILSLSAGVRVPYYKTKLTSYNYVEPRVTTKVSLTNESSIKASYTKMHQFMHLVTGSTSALPTDIWIPSSSVIQPQKSDQFALGYYRNYDNNKFETSLELYHKTMSNQVLFSEGTILTEVTNYDDVTTFGSGTSYGVELFVKKNIGKFTGWMSYTYSKTTQKFDELNNGKEFDFKYDRTHNFSLTSTFKLNSKWSFSGSFVYYTGSAFSIPTGRFFIENGGSLHSRQYPIYTERNNSRLPAHHRLDIGATRNQQHRFFGKTYDTKWVFSIYNLYSRQNAFFVYTDVNIKTNKPIAKQISILPITPGISYSFKF